MLNQANQGYDHSLTMFNPDGRLFQVEYALEAVRRGTLAIGLKSDAGACLITLKKYSKLMEPNSIKKIYPLDGHIGCSIAGLHADSRILVDYTRVQCQVHRLTYGEPVRVQTIVRQIAKIMQNYTQHGGIRPFGCSLMFIGVDPDNKAYLMTTSPSGIYKAWKGATVGRNSGEAKDRLAAELTDELSLDELIRLGVKTLQESVEDDIDAKSLQIAHISVEDGLFKVMSEEECQNYL